MTSCILFLLFVMELQISGWTEFLQVVRIWTICYDLQGFVSFVVSNLGALLTWCWNRLRLVFDSMKLLLGPTWSRSRCTTSQGCTLMQLTYTQSQGATIESRVKKLDSTKIIWHRNLTFKMKSLNLSFGAFVAFWTGLIYVCVFEWNFRPRWNG